MKDDIALDTGPFYLGTIASIFMEVNMKNKIIAIILSLVYICTLFNNIPIFAEGDTKVYLNNELIEFDQPPIIEDGRTLVPLRKIFEALGVFVEWFEEAQVVQGKKGDTHIQLKINSNIMIKNGGMITLDVPAKIINNRTLVPVRAISEAFEVSVFWDGEKNTVYLESPDDFVQKTKSDIKGEITFVDSDNNVILTRFEIKEASVENTIINSSTENKEIVILLTLTEEGRNKFAAATEALAIRMDGKNYISILVDGKIISSPRVMAKIDSEVVIITGDFTLESARELASKINGNENVYVSPDIVTE